MTHRGRESCKRILIKDAWKRLGEKAAKLFPRNVSGAPQPSNPNGLPEQPIDYNQAFIGETMRTRESVTATMIVLECGGRDTKWKYLFIDNATANDPAMPYKVRMWTNSADSAPEAAP
jgi:hypothetical protein